MNRFGEKNKIILAENKQKKISGVVDNRQMPKVTATPFLRNFSGRIVRKNNAKVQNKWHGKINHKQ